MILKKVSKLLILVVLTLGLWSCSKSKIKVEGQVFIVTQGGTNFPLGLVSIGIAKSSEFLEDLEIAFEEYNSLVFSKEMEIGDLKNKIEIGYSEKNEAWNRVKIEAEKLKLSSFANIGQDYALLDAKPRFNSFKNFMNMNEESRDRKIETDGVLKLKERYKLEGLEEYYFQKTKLDNLLESYLSLEISLLEFKQGHTILSNFNSNYFLTKTNSRGEFSVDLEKGDYFIFAKSSRKIGNEEENYLWVQQFTASNNIADLYLSNDNFVSVSDLERLLK